MSEAEKHYGHTLLVKCKCGCCKLVYCATRTVIEEEEHKIVYCQRCSSDMLIFLRMRGKHSLEEMKSYLNA